MPRRGIVYMPQNEIELLARTVEDLREEIRGLRKSVSPVDTLWTFEDLAKFLRLSETTVRRKYDKEWGVPYELIGGSVRFVPEIVKDHFIRNNLVAGRSQKKRYEKAYGAST